MLGFSGKTKPARSLRDAMALAARARAMNLDTLDDPELDLRLWTVAAEACERSADAAMSTALGLVDAAVRRRLGIWKAVLSDSADLTGEIRMLREMADDLLAAFLHSRPLGSDGREWTRRIPALADAAAVGGGSREALRWLLTVRARLATERPSEIPLPSDFYRSIEAVDDGRCLVFQPTQRQLAAAALLIDGAIVEMDAGEGKSLTAGMAAAILAASGRSVHVLTANDYLAARDCEDLAPVLESLGVTLGLITDNMDRYERLHQYTRRVVFTTAREVGFDYLRDSVARSMVDRVNPVFDVAIVDEADHLLIDQARVPLIISGDPSPESVMGVECESVAVELIEEQARRVDEMYDALASAVGGSRDARLHLAKILLAGGLSGRLISALEMHGVSARESFADMARMNDDEDGRPLERDLLFTVDPRAPSLMLTDEGWDVVARRLEHQAMAFEVVQMLRARVVHEADEDYVVAEGGITLVDQLDGRPMYAHRYMGGLQEALEAKEGIEGRGWADTKARTTIHALMSRYSAISGLTGTAQESADIFASDFRAPVVRVRPETESKRVDLAPVVFFDRAEHIRCVAEEVAKWHRVGRPVLLSVGSVSDSSTFSDELTSRGVSHRVLSASNPFHETEIVAGAGRFGAVTVSTGMAGRGTDIIVGRETDSRTVSAFVDEAARRIRRGQRLIFRSDSPEQASILEAAMAEAADADTSRAGTQVVVKRRGWQSETTVRLDFGLGLIVVIASLPASVRVERQIRGRTARQGSFGATKTMARVNDPVIAFSRQQSALMDLKRPAATHAGGAEVERLLRQIQIEAETQRRAAAGVSAELAAIIEAECRAHYAARERLMHGARASAWLAVLVADWVERVTATLDDASVGYAERFDSVADSLWDEWGIDVGASAGLAPPEVRETLSDEVNRRLFRHRDRLGARRLGCVLAEMYLDAVDALWPDRLMELQDMALSVTLGAHSRRAAFAQLSEQIEESRPAFWRRADDMALGCLLVVESYGDMGDNQIERLPSNLSALLD